MSRVEMTITREPSFGLRDLQEDHNLDVTEYVVTEPAKFLCPLGELRLHLGNRKLSEAFDRLCCINC